MQNSTTPNETSVPDESQLSLGSSGNLIHGQQIVGRQLSQTELDDILSNYTMKQPTVEGYKPVFSDTARTIIYVVCAILGLLGGIVTLVAATSNAPAWLTISAAVLAWAAPYLANAFGVAYNPIRLANAS